MKKLLAIILLINLALLNSVSAEPELTPELKAGKEKALTICSGSSCLCRKLCFNS